MGTVILIFLLLIILAISILLDQLPGSSLCANLLENGPQDAQAGRGKTR